MELCQTNKERIKICFVFKQNKKLSYQNLQFFLTTYVIKLRFTKKKKIKMKHVMSKN